MARVVFAGGQVFDGTGAAPAPADVAVEAGRIVAVGTGLDGDEVVDCAGRAVLPGLFDCHVHLIVGPYDQAAQLHEPFSIQFYRAALNMRTTLGVGITTVRDACGADLGVKEAQRRGMIPGPRVHVSIGQVSQTGGQGDHWEPSGCCPTGVFTPHPGRPACVVDGPDAVRVKVRELIRAGADVIKVATSGGVVSPARANPLLGHFRDAEIAVMVEEATAAGISVMSHARSTEGIKVAVRNGVRSIEHGDLLDDEAIDLMLARGTWLVPTLMANSGVLTAAAHGISYPEHMLEKARVLHESQTRSVRRAIAAGIRIAFGTDSGVTAHGRNLEELGLLVDCGMTPAQALRSATRSAAELMGLDADLGTVEPGKRADLVVVDGDPLDVATLADRIVSVHQDGKLVHSGQRG
ncbi:amidohydrolase family protein [Phytohabitans sp. ZYX-F-186]|uniref:Amidohydrolase family protein n=1 Tax=Phytohabitans maris TaxID=3071409 RepID=A0ABU0ZMV4_9ACTN|nr:amidohydrolase family protein [Phytohabitans sp. ZYX-F-186]MDQ7908288.1 amidohydrolase family protein [Phytohabitans sp. ZYX-F-186]